MTPLPDNIMRRFHAPPGKPAHHPAFWFCILMMFTLPVSGQGRLVLNKFETPDIKLVFLDKTSSYLVPHTVKSFTNSLGFHRNFWDYQPSGKTNILFNDFTDLGNGGTMVIPWNFLNIAVAPFDYTFSVVPSNERFQWLMIHELVHQVMCDKDSKSDRLYRTLLGGKVMPDNRDPVSLIYSYLTTPRWYSPRWYQEGIAVFMETWMSGGIGRALGGYDEMVFRSMVRDSAYFYHVVGLETEGTTIDFQVGANAYLYGTRFVSYLAYTYGIDRLRDFYSRSDTSKRFYARQFEHVYGTSVENVWANWIRWEKEFQQNNLGEIRKNPPTEFRPLSPVALGSVSRQYYDKERGKLIMAVNYPGKLAHIAGLDIRTGHLENIAPVGTPNLYYVTSLAWDDSSKTIFASTWNKDWRGLQSVDARTGQTRELMKITRCGNLVFDKHGKALWGVQSLAGRTTLVRIPAPFNRYDEIMTLPYGKEIFDTDISPDGTLLSATLSDVTGKQQLVVYRIAELLSGSTEGRILHEFEDNPAANFVFSPDGRFLYGTSYYTGVSNIFRVSVDTAGAQILSNAETGFFRPLPVSADSMVFFNYTPDGMVAGITGIKALTDVNPVTYLGQLTLEKHRELEQWRLPPLSTINLDSIPVTETRYRPLSELRLAGAYPIIQGYKQYAAAGYRLNFMDPMSLNALTVKLSVSPYDSLPMKQVPHLSAEYRYWNWTFTGNYNYADFYDLFGPTRFSRAGYSVSARYNRVINRNSPGKTELSAKVTAYGDLEKLPFYQNITSDYKNLFTGVFNFHRSWLRKSLGAVEPEQGYDWNAYAWTSLAGKTFYPQLINNFDFGFLLPMRNSSFWFRTSLGQSFGPHDKSNSFFYFGGFGNNYLDYRSAQQYREMSSFPGMEIDAIPALNYGKLTLEANLTPVRFRKLGFTGLYATYARLTLFGIGMHTNLGKDLTAGDYLSAGAQLDWEIVFFSLLKTTLSAGYARAWAAGKPEDLFMVSLKF